LRAAFPLWNFGQSTDVVANGLCNADFLEVQTMLIRLIDMRGLSGFSAL
jgi:hypothetical protein